MRGGGRSFARNAPGWGCGGKNCWPFEKPVCWLISVGTRPCEVFTHPDRTNLRDDVVLTVPLTVPSADVVSAGVTTGAGAPMVFSVTSPVTCVAAWSRYRSSVAVVWKYWLLFATLTANRCGLASLHNPAK